jgi:hypothetical protein
MSEVAELRERIQRLERLVAWLLDKEPIVSEEHLNCDLITWEMLIENYDIDAFNHPVHS